MAPFVLMGSGEFLPWAGEVDRWAIESSTVASDRVIVSPAAAAPEGDEVFDRWARMGLEHFERLGLAPEVLPVKTRADAEDPAVAKCIAGARYVFFSGGNPGSLVETLSGTPVWTAVLDAVRSGTALGGCSAGMVALGALAPDMTKVGNGDHEAWIPGLRVFPRGFFGAHWDMLDAWEPGLTQRVLDVWPAGSVLFALDENTAACGDGSTWSVRGSGALTIPGHDGLERVASGGSATVDLGLSL